MKTNRTLSASLTVSFLVGLAIACGACASTSPDGDEESTDATSAALMRGGLGANGDSCTVRTKPDGTTVPGTEKDGECCSTADTTDCVIILKPFPGSFSLRIR